MEKQCPNCGKTFVTDNRCRKYCSNACRRDFFRKNCIEQSANAAFSQKTCPICGKKFTPTSRSYQKYCSKECKDVFIRAYNKTHWRETHPQKERDPLVCPQCGKTFVPANAHITFCSPECQYKHQYALHKERLNRTEEPFYNPRHVYSCAEIAFADDIMEYFSEKWIAIDAELPWYQKHTCTLMHEEYPC